MLKEAGTWSNCHFCDKADGRMKKALLPFYFLASFQYPLLAGNQLEHVLIICITTLGGGLGAERQWVNNQHIPRLNCSPPHLSLPSPLVLCVYRSITFVHTSLYTQLNFLVEYIPKSGIPGLTSVCILNITNILGDIRNAHTQLLFTNIECMYSFPHTLGITDIIKLVVVSICEMKNVNPEMFSFEFS